MKRKPRILKKLHRHWLELAVIDLSQDPIWRELLFNSEYNSEFPINSENCEGLWKPAIKALRKYGLEYTVSKVPKNQAVEPWLAEGGLVVFEFKAKKFPAVHMQTGNNPDVI
ncbi:hypothetical protein ACG1BZ_17305 [Microbulbifer sp. CNSA002]|uniref:hypothetical protein n=1 Tax=Microbulbifer sp. CNSA002 TaxID=3373604 RepID=UPI0039B5A6B3